MFFKKYLQRSNPMGWNSDLILRSVTNRGISMVQVLEMMIIGKTVKVRHKPVLAVIESCSGWGKGLNGPIFRHRGIRHWGDLGRRLCRRVIRESESLPAG